MSLKDLPPEARPREKLLARGAGALRDVELLALDAQNRLLAMEEMFRGTLTQLSVTLLRKHFFGWFRHFTATQSESRLWSRTPSCRC